MWFSEDNTPYIAEWIPSKPDLPVDVLAELYPEYWQFGPYPTEFQDLLETLRSMLRENVSFSSLMQITPSDSYDLISEVNRTAKQGGPIGARAAFLNSGSSDMTQIFMNAASYRYDPYAAASILVYLAVIDPQLGRYIINGSYLETVHKNYESMQAELASKLALT